MSGSRRNARGAVSSAVAPEQHPLGRDRQGRWLSGIKLLQLNGREQFCPMSAAMERSDAVLFHREML
jgi:hypothetical protein